MPYVAPSSTAASSSSSDIIARIRKGSVGQASASSSSQDAGTNGKDGIVDGNQRRKESEDITAQDDQDESMTHPQPRSFLQVVDDEPTPRPETVKSSPLDRSLDVPATSANTDNSDSDHLSAQLENTVLADQPLATSPGDLPASEPGFTELQPESQSQSQDHERGNSNNSNSTASTSSSVSTYETETEGEGYSTSEYASGSGPDTPATATSVDTSGGGGRVVRGVKGFHAWELTEELMRYKNELYNYTVSVVFLN